MLELTIPQPGEDTKTCKDLVFSILTREQPLSIIELANRIRKNHNVGVTYQAVRKAVNGLHDQSVLKKKGKKYAISKAWVLRMKALFDNLLASYETGKHVHAFSDELVKEDYAVYTFSNLFDLDNFWSGVMEHWADSIRKGERPVYFSYLHYSFWFLVNLGQETRLFKHMIAKGARAHCLFLSDTPLNAWGMELYRETGTNVCVAADLGISDTMGLNLLGDTVVQVKYPESILKRLRNVYAKHSGIQELSLREVTEIAHEQGEIKFIMFKNPTIAKALRETYLPLFA